MISNLKKPILLILILIFTLSSCVHGDTTGNGPIKNPGEPRFTDEESKIAVFENGEPEGFWARNDRGNGHPFNCSFSAGNAVIDKDALTISLVKNQGGFSGAEYRSWKKTGYGFYSVKMKAAACSGVISSFFIYNGRPWDEIDIEFLGDDTTRVQFNYYTAGVGGHEYIYELGFDASKEFHEYAFDWQEGSITWYVDGVAVYQATNNIPSSPGYIMMNIWNVADTNAGWAGRFDETKLPVSAQYQWIGYQGVD